MIPLVAAFQLLTICPEIIRRPLRPRDLGRAAGWYPLVGLTLGGALYGLDVLFGKIFPAPVSVALTLAGWIAATRALHLDGFMDTCDGLFGGFTPERRLEIMRDPRLGAFGVAGGVLLILTKYSAILSLSDRLPALLLAPAFARWGLTVAIFAYPYGRKQGLGREIKDNTGWREVLLATLTILVAGWLIAGWAALLLLAAAGVVLFLAAHYMLHLIPGLTGDNYGALCELVELIVLLSFTLPVWR